MTNEATITRPVIEAVKDLTLVVGRLSQDVTITFATTGGPTGSVTLYADDTATNTTILSLVSDLNKALSVPTLKTGVLSDFSPTGPVTFNVGINNATPVLVELTASALADNTSLADLVEDINAKLKDTPFGAADQHLSDFVTAKSSGASFELGKARVKFEAASTVTRLEITPVGVNALALSTLPTSSVATSFAGQLVADSIGNKLVLSVMKDIPDDEFPASAITQFTVAADAGAAALGLAAGPAPSNNDDFEIRVSNPASTYKVTMTRCRGTASPTSMELSTAIMDAAVMPVLISAS